MNGARRWWLPIGAFWKRVSPVEAAERLQAADGSWHDWLTLKFPLRDAGGRTYVGGVSIDVTQQRQAEIVLQRYAERLKTLHQIDQAILAAQSPQQIAEAALERIAQLVPCERASLVAFELRCPAGSAHFRSCRSPDPVFLRRIPASGLI